MSNPQPEYTQTSQYPAPEYPQPEYPQTADYSQPADYAQPGYPQQVQPSTATTLAYTNTFALVSIITAFLSPIAAIVFGHMALSQIKRTGDAGRGLALTGLIIGYAYFVMIALFVLFYLSMIGIMIASFGAIASEVSSSGLPS